MKAVQSLLAWYRRNRRKLPWRSTRDPYRIWLSEVMLQQTQVSRVTGFYERFLEKYPDLKSLAKARWPGVLSVWRGLGYYHRAQNLLACAKVLDREYGGKFPRSVEELQSLPGIGPYTASAVAAIAYGKERVAFDTNVARIMSRYTGKRDPKECEAAAYRWLRSVPGSARSFNQALMDLGSLVCRAPHPSCDLCPLRQGCTYRKVLESKAPRKRSSTHRSAAQTAEEVQDVGIACIHQGGRYLFAKRPEDQGGLWEFPGGKRETGESIRSCLKREIYEEIGIEISVRPAFMTKKVMGRKRMLRLHFCRCRILRGKPKAHEHDALSWVAPEQFDEFPMPEANTPALKRLQQFRR